MDTEIKKTWRQRHPDTVGQRKLCCPVVSYCQIVLAGMEWIAFLAAGFVRIVFDYFAFGSKPCASSTPIKVSISSLRAWISCFISCFMTFCSSLNVSSPISRLSNLLLTDNKANLMICQSFLSTPPPCPVFHIFRNQVVYIGIERFIPPAFPVGFYDGFSAFGKVYAYFVIGFFIVFIFIFNWVKFFHKNPFYILCKIYKKYNRILCKMSIYILLKMCYTIVAR